VLELSSSLLLADTSQPTGVPFPDLCQPFVVAYGPPLPVLESGDGGVASIMDHSPRLYMPGFTAFLRLMLISQGKSDFQDTWLDGFDAFVSAFPSLVGWILVGLEATGAPVLHPPDQ
jgi:hypothetical protein